MNLREVVRAVLYRWWLVIAAMAIALGISGTLTIRAVPQYATTLTFFVTTPDDKTGEMYQGDGFVQQRVKSYTSVFTGDRLARAVAGSGIGLSVSEIQARVRAEAVPGTVLLKVTVADSDPARSKRLATELAKQFPALVEALETLPGDDSPAVKVEVVAGPALDAAAISPRPLRSLGTGALLGLLAGAAAAALRERRDQTVKTAEALEGVTGVPTLAVVPFDSSTKHIRLAAGDHVGAPYAESFRHLRTKPQFTDLGHGLKVVVVTSSTAERGKPVVAANLALTFAEAGWRVLLVEADVRRHRLTGYLGIERTTGLADVLVDGADPNDAIVRYGRDAL